MSAYSLLTVIHVYRGTAATSECYMLLRQSAAHLLNDCHSIVDSNASLIASGCLISRLNDIMPPWVAQTLAASPLVTALHL